MNGFRSQSETTCSFNSSLILRIHLTSDQKLNSVSPSLSSCDRSYRWNREVLCRGGEISALIYETDQMNGHYYLDSCCSYSHQSTKWTKFSYQCVLIRCCLKVMNGQNMLFWKKQRWISKFVKQTFQIKDMQKIDFHHLFNKSNLKTNRIRHLQKVYEPFLVSSLWRLLLQPLLQPKHLL